MAAARASSLVEERSIIDRINRRKVYAVDQLLDRPPPLPDYVYIYIYIYALVLLYSRVNVSCLLFRVNGITVASSSKYYLTFERRDVKYI